MGDRQYSRKRNVKTQMTLPKWHLKTDVTVASLTRFLAVVGILAMEKGKRKIMK